MPEEKARIKKEWLSAIVDASHGKVPKTVKSSKRPAVMKPTQEIEPLKRIQLFEQLSDEELSSLAETCHKESFKAGERIFEEGAIGDKFFMLQKGEVRISKIIQGIGEEALVVLKEGSYFGEMALIDESPRSATAICNTNTVALVIDKEDFDKLLHEDHEIATKLLWTFVRTLSVRLRETNEKIKGFFAMTGGNQW
jgi:CRP-like cAMP-binding protein